MPRANARASAAETTDLFPALTRYEAGDLERAARAVEFHRLAAMERLERTS